MYNVKHTFDDLEKGEIIIWNGAKVPVQSVADESAVIGSTELTKEEINKRFASEDIPFEMEI